MTQHSNLLSSENSLLLVVDIQTKLTSVMPEGAAEDMQENSSRLIESANLLNIPVFATEQYPQGLGATVDSLKAKFNSDTVYFEKRAFPAVQRITLMPRCKIRTQTNHYCGSRDPCLYIANGFGTFTTRLSSTYT